MYIGADLGSTNIKAAFYDKEFKLIHRKSRPVNYIRDNGFVEFDAWTYYQELVGLSSETKVNVGTLDHFAGAVMEGEAFVLCKNCDHIAANGVKPSAIITTGGGAKSPIWCQMQADITGLPLWPFPKKKKLHAWAQP